jgi:hypothetical protein
MTWTNMVSPFDRRTDPCGRSAAFQMLRLPGAEVAPRLDHPSGG